MTGEPPSAPSREEIGLLAFQVWSYKQGEMVSLTWRDDDRFELTDAGAAALPSEPTFDLVLTLDCLHDMTQPAQTIAAIRRSIADDGTWLVKDIRCADVAKDNLANPMAAMMYGFSIASCMSSAMSEPDGAGLGTLGLPPDLLAQLCEDAGFTRFRIHDIDEPANLYYEIRP